MLSNIPKTVSQDVLEIFNDPDIAFNSIIKTLATEFGSDATLRSVNQAFQDNKPVPKKTINGKEYFAGYRGRYMQSEGTVDAELIDIRENGSNVKCMFNPSGGAVFVYFNFPKEDVKVDQIVKLATKLNTKFTIRISHETIAATGEKHATVSEVVGMDEILSNK